MNTLPETPVQLLTLMANTSTQIDVFSDGIIQAVQGGEINPLAVLVQLKAMEQATERIRKEIRPNMLIEIDKYPDTFEYLGNKITKAEHGMKYDFSNCGDPEWEQYEHDRLSAANSLKDREAFLKSLKEPIDIIDRRTGEVVTITPPTKKSTSGINISIR